MTDQQEIKNTIQTYFDCMYESSSEKARKAFHPHARITGYLPDGLHEMTVDDFAGLVQSQQPSPKEKGDGEVLEIISLEIAGNTAVAKVRDAYIGFIFLDILSFLKVDDTWVIYNKLFHVES